MAASLVQTIGHAHIATGNSITITVPALGVTVGNTIIVALGWNSVSNDPTGITDTGGNTYTQDASKNDAGNTKRVRLYSAPVTTGMVAGATIQASWTAGPSRMLILAVEVSGLPASGIVDVTASNNGTNTVLDSGSVATTVAAEFWMMAALESIGAATSFTLTADGSWNALVTEANVQGSANLGLATEYQIVAATGTMHPAPTSSISGTYGGLCVAYKAASAGPTNTVAPAVTGNPWVGQTLTSTTGTWTGTGGITYAYQWQKDGVNIGGATASTYVIVSGDSTHALRCVVTATDNTGSSPANSNTVTPGPSFTATPSLGGEFCDFAVVVYTPGGITPPGLLRQRKRGSQRLIRCLYRYAIYPRS
jgi:hypothetical protein